MSLKYNRKAITSIGIIILCIMGGWYAYTIAPKPDEPAELEAQPAISEIPGGYDNIYLAENDPSTEFNYPPCNTVVFMGSESETTLELEWFPFENAVNFSMVMGERLETLTITGPDGEVVWRHEHDVIHITVPELTCILQRANPAVDFQDSAVIANELIYQCNLYGFKDQDMPYVLALLWSESRFNPDAKAETSTASGVGQLLRMHWIDDQDPFDPAWNISRSIEIMAAHYNADWPTHMRWRRIMERYTGGTLGGMLYVSKFQEELR